MEYEHLKRMKLERYAAINTMSTCLQHIKKQVATFDTEKELPSISNSEHLSSERQKGARSTYTKDSLIQFVASMYSGYALHVEKKGNVPYCDKAVYELATY